MRPRPVVHSSAHRSLHHKLHLSMCICYLTSIHDAYKFVRMCAHTQAHARAPAHIQSETERASERGGKRVWDARSEKNTRVEHLTESVSLQASSGGIENEAFAGDAISKSAPCAHPRDRACET